MRMEAPRGKGSGEWKFWPLRLRPPPSVELVGLNKQGPAVNT